MRFGHRPLAVLKTLTPSHLDQLRASGTVRNYQKKESIYTVGQATDALHLVLRGRIRLRDRDREGRQITVSFAAQGEVFGLEALAEMPRRVLSAAAAEGSEVLSIEVAALQELLSRDIGLINRWLRHLAAATNHADERIKMLAFLDVPSRLAGTLMWLADRYGVVSEEGVEIPYWFTHQELADLIGSTRETVTTILAEFKKENLVTSRSHRFVILDRTALSERIGLPGFGQGDESV